MESKKTICVDFDGVIHKYSLGWASGAIYDDSIEGASTVLSKLVTSGYKVVIFTTRASSVDAVLGVKKWLERYGMRENTHWHEITNIKPQAIAYIDDRAIRFTNWQDIGKYFI